MSNLEKTISNATVHFGRQELGSLAVIPSYCGKLQTRLSEPYTSLEIGPVTFFNLEPAQLRLIAVKCLQLADEFEAGAKVDPVEPTEEPNETERADDAIF